MKDKGVTLIELLVVISVIGILAVALGFSYVGWQGKYKVEKATKEIHSALMTARSMAMTRSRDCFMDFPTTRTYRVSMDNSSGGTTKDNGDGVLQPQANPLVETNDTDTTVLQASKGLIPTSLPLEYTISSDAGGTITFGKRGLISSPSLPSVSAEVVICLSTTADPDYDCIEISQTRLIMGKLTTQINNGGACNATNCVAK